MTMGEHEYRNREYETLVHICSHAERPAVVACGDGVLLDDMSASLIKEHELIILDMDTDVDVLWQNALKTAAPHTMPSCTARISSKKEEPLTIFTDAGKLFMNGGYYDLQKKQLS